MFATAQAALDAAHDEGPGNAVIVEGQDTIALSGALKSQLHLATSMLPGAVERRAAGPHADNFALYD